MEAVCRCTGLFSGRGHEGQGKTEKDDPVQIVDAGLLRDCAYLLLQCEHPCYTAAAAFREYNIRYPDEGRESKDHREYRADKRGGLPGPGRIFLGMSFLYHGHKFRTNR